MTPIGGGAQTLSYDLNGNLTGDGSTTYAYDATNRLLSISGFVTASYGYDALDRRSSKTAGGTTTRFLHAGSDEIGEYTSAGTLLRRYVPGPGTNERAALIDSGAASPPATAIKYPHTDRQGSVMSVTDSTGAVSERFAYDGFGRSNSALSGYPFRYTGQRLDFESGLMFYKARVYSTSLGRFLQTDPIGTKDDLHLYAYVGNDPVNGTDPTGNCKFSGPMGIPNLGCYLADGLAYGVQPILAPDYSHDSVRNDIYDVITQPLKVAGDVAPAFPVLAPARATRSAAALSDDVALTAGSIRNVNKVGGTLNCINCVVATDAVLAGRPASALAGGAGPISILERTFGSRFAPVSGQAAIESQLLAAGSGARGVVYGGRGADEVGHVFNAVNQKGTIRFLDGQTGKAAEFSGYDYFLFMRTN